MQAQAVGGLPTERLLFQRARSQLKRPLEILAGTEDQVAYRQNLCRKLSEKTVVWLNGSGRGFLRIFPPAAIAVEGGWNCGKSLCRDPSGVSCSVTHAGRNENRLLHK